MECQENRIKELEKLLYSWSIPLEPLSCMHVDYARPYEGKYWLIVIDMKINELTKVIDRACILSLSCMHVDYARPYEGKYWLIVIDMKINELTKVIDRACILLHRRMARSSNGIIIFSSF